MQHIEPGYGAVVRCGVVCSWSVDTVSLAGDGDIVVLRLVGEFDLSTDPILREALGAVIARAPVVAAATRQRHSADHHRRGERVRAELAAAVAALDMLTDARGAQAPAPTYRPETADQP